MSSTDIPQETFKYLRRRLEDLSDGGSEAAFDPKVFWSVNALIFCIIVGSCIWYRKFGHLMLSDQGRNASDLAFRQSVLEREQRRLERKRDSPEKRRKRLMQSFQRQSVSMVSCSRFDKDLRRVC